MNMQEYIHRCYAGDDYLDFNVKDENGRHWAILINRDRELAFMSRLNTKMKRRTSQAPMRIVLARVDMERFQICFRPVSRSLFQ